MAKSKMIPVLFFTLCLLLNTLVQGLALPAAAVTETITSGTTTITRLPGSSVPTSILFGTSAAPAATTITMVITSTTTNGVLTEISPPSINSTSHPSSASSTAASSAALPSTPSGIVSTKASSSLTTSSTNTVSPTQPTLLPSTPANVTIVQDNGGWSAGEKIGVGVGAAVFVLIIIAGIFLMWRNDHSAQDACESVAGIRERVANWHLDPSSRPPRAETVFSETTPAPPLIPLSEIQSQPPSRPPRPDSRATTFNENTRNMSSASPAISSRTTDWNLNPVSEHPITPDDVTLMNGQHVRNPSVPPSLLSHRKLHSDGVSLLPQDHLTIQQRRWSWAQQAPETQPEVSAWIADHPDYHDENHPGFKGYRIDDGRRSSSSPIYFPPLGMKFTADGTPVTNRYRPYVLEDEDDDEIKVNKRKDTMDHLQGTAENDGVRTPSYFIIDRARRILEQQKGFALPDGRDSTPSLSGTIRRARPEAQTPGSQTVDKRYIQQQHNNSNKKLDPDRVLKTPKGWPTSPYSSETGSQRRRANRTSLEAAQHQNRASISPQNSSYSPSPATPSSSGPLPSPPFRTRSRLGASEEFAGFNTNEFELAELEG